jgi:putative membrane protein
MHDTDIATGGVTMIRFIVRLLISGAVIFGVSYLSNGALLQVDAFGWAVLMAFALGIVNAFIKPVIAFFALPVTIITLGLFSLLINAGMLALAAAVVPGVRTTGFWSTVLAALIISVVTSLATGWLERKDAGVSE